MDEEVGSVEDIKKLVKRAHSRGYDKAIKEAISRGESKARHFSILVS